MDFSTEVAIAIIGVMLVIARAIEWGAKSLYSFATKKDYGMYDTKQEVKDASLLGKIILNETLFSEHCKANESAFSAMHNGLNANATSLQNMANEIVSIRLSVEKLSTILEERVPRK